MSKSIVITSAVELPAKVRRAATSLGNTYRVRKGEHINRLRHVNTLMNLGLSTRGVEAAVTVAMGYRPTGFNSTAVGSYALIRAQFARDDVAATVATDADTELVVNAMYRLAGPTPKGLDSTPAERVTALANLIAKGGPKDVATHVEAALKAFNAKEVTAATTPAQREVAGTPGAVESEPEAEGTPAEVASGGGHIAGEDERLAGIGTMSLIAGLTRRLTALGAVDDAGLSEALTALIEAAESVLTPAEVEAEVGA